jgi:hypothetical protein
MIAGRLAVSLRSLPVFHHTGPQEGTNQVQDTLVVNPHCHPPHQNIVTYAVEEFLEIQTYNPALPWTVSAQRRGHGLQDRCSDLME